MIIKKGEADLFSAPEKFIFAHCIAFDLKLGAGIALEFRKRYPNLIPYLHQNIPNNYPNIIGYCDSSGRYIYNLITKESSYGKPTRNTLNQTLIQLKESMINLNQKYLAIPLLGSGLDRLNWNDTENFIRDIFQDTDIMISICMLKKR